MKKEIKKIIIIILLIVIYLVVGKITHLYFECPIHKITGFYCPGCGLTRMFDSMLNLDFYQAFRYNPLVFILLIPMIFLYIENMYSNIKNKKSIYSKLVSTKVLIVLLIILILYGILRNIIPWLAPTVI